MPTNPKIFTARSSTSYYYNSRRSTILTLCFIIGFTGFIFGFTAISKRVLGGYNCKYAEPRSVSVAWDRRTSIGKGGGAMVEKESGLTDGEYKRHKVMGFVGIQTGFGSVARRRSLRRTWFPSDHQGLQKLEEATGLSFRFVIGRTSDKSKMSALKKEVAEYDDFVLLDIEEEYSKLPYKTLAFFKAAYALYDSEFYVKADDDIYLRPDRLSLLLAKERSHSQTYLGCMKKGPVFTDPKLKCFRMFSNEDVTIGAWMLAMNVNHENNKQLCEPECTASSIAVWDIPKCSGLCNPEKKMLKLHANDVCSKSPTLPSEDD
ncbi:probable beta-1,3-galactosyltransferase 14 isoform X2 [Lycium barbarum]|uniref:probable beta-1,3-galactosyltransferase 14 isoform X2 n=1 Tax=Lycium barbarum TaxID=112863 RepID=UPI00293F796C|nr:probable beta-1,3-galactosyltransferase 14 isoform X2 [Lycium barbarum]